MAHGMTESDNAAFYERPGWHGLGEVVQHVMSPLEAAGIAFPWDVLQCPLRAIMPDDRWHDVPGWVANIRSDTRETLGVVRDGFTPVQNTELAKLVYAIAEDCPGDIVIESAGSLKGGRLVYMLARAKSLIRVGETGSDVSVPYLALMNGHDGSMSLSIQPTAIRVQCLNTFRMAMSERATRFTFRHSGGILERVKAAQGAIRAALKGIEEYQQQAQDLARTVVLPGDLMEFYRKVYEGHWGRIPVNGNSDAERRSERRAARIIGAWTALSTQPQNTVDGIGGTAWSALNSVTEWADHSKTVRGNGDARVFSNLLGTSHDLKAIAHRTALELV